MKNLLTLFFVFVSLAASFGQVGNVFTGIEIKNSKAADSVRIRKMWYEESNQTFMVWDGAGKHRIGSTIGGLVQGTNILTQNLNFDGAFNVKWGAVTPINLFNIKTSGDNDLGVGTSIFIHPTSNNANIYMDATHAEIIGNSNAAKIYVGGGSGGTGVDITTSTSSTGVRLIGGSSNTVELDLINTAGGALFTDGRIAKRGLEYAATGYVTQLHSLVDKEYAHALVGGSPLSFSNGLTNTAGVVKLGGILTANTNIDGAFTVNFGSVTPLTGLSISVGSGVIVMTPTQSFLGVTGASISTDIMSTNKSVRISANGSTNTLQQVLGSDPNPGGVSGYTLYTDLTNYIKRIVVTEAGIFKFLPAVAPVVGQVITATNVDGTWTWQTPSSGGMTNPMTAVGDLIQGTTAGAPARLASVATGNALISGGVTTANSWGKITSAHIDATVQTAGLSWLLTGTSTLTGVATITSNAKNQHIFNGAWTATAAADAHIQFGGTLTAASGLGVTGYVIKPSLVAVGALSVQIGLDVAPTFSGGTSPVNIAARFQNGAVAIGPVTTQPSGESLYIMNNQNASTTQTISNTTSGASATTGIVLSSSGTSLQIFQMSPGFTTSGILQSSSAALFSTGAFNIGSTTAAQVGFWTNNTERARILSTGEFLVGYSAVMSGELVGVRKDQNANTRLVIVNNTSGTAAVSNLVVSNSATLASAMGLATFSAGYASTSLFVANTAALYSSMSGGLNIGTLTSTPILFWVNNFVGGSVVPNTFTSGVSHWTFGSSGTGQTAIVNITSIGVGVPTLLVANGAPTNLTASTEVLNVNLNTSATVQYATGAQTILRNVLVQAPTIGFVGASVVTDNATFTITGPPKAGTNATQTNAHGLLIQAGAVTSAGAAFGLTANAPTGGTVNYAGQGIGGSWLFAAGTTTYAPIIIPSGTNLTTTKAGALENDGTHLYFTFANSGTRYQLDQQSGGSGITVGTTTITSGTSTRIPFNDGGVYNEDAGLVYDKTNDALTIGVSGIRLHSSGSATTNIFIGNTTGNFTGTGASNVIVGANGLQSYTSGTLNSAIGRDALSAVTSGSRNTGIGNNALHTVATADGNTGVGQAALNLATAANNTGIGYGAGSNITSGANNIIIGALLDAQSATGSDQLSIQNIIFGTGNSGTGTTLSTGNIGIGISAPTAKLSIAGGTTTVPPLGLTSGTNLTTPIAGAFEYNGVNLFFTPSGTTRKTASLYQVVRSTAQTGANASVTTWTVGANDGTFLVSANVLVTASTTHAFTVTCTYTDEGNTSRVVTLTLSQLGGTLGTSVANTAGTVPYEGVPLHIRCKAATTITIGTTGTFTSVTYNVEGSIAQIN
jgi:hypothetical protein